LRPGEEHVGAVDETESVHPYVAHVSIAKQPPNAALAVRMTPFTDDVVEVVEYPAGQVQVL